MQIDARTILLSAIGILLAGCNISGPAYSGPRLPREQVALVTSDDTLEIAKIDGTRYFRRPVRDVEVLPGEHAFIVVYFGVYYAGRTHSHESPVHFNARAGRSYRISADFQPSSRSEMITNLGVGRLTLHVLDVTAKITPR